MSFPARATEADIDAAVAALRGGELVAFPTETVYGLGADALDPAALRRIFELKGRPAEHPLILHLASAQDVDRWVAQFPPLAERLAARFWPGPLTLVLPRGPDASDVLTGGQDTVALRVPSHPVAQQLLRAFGGGIAAPSANRYGHVSPTRAEHVRDEFGAAVRIVLDGGECTLGLESTIVSLVGARPRLLRPGHVSLAQLVEVVGPVDVGADRDSPRVPGSTLRHYAPQTPVRRVAPLALEARIDEVLREEGRVAVLSLHAPARRQAAVTWIDAGSGAEQYAHDLYANLRSLDKAGAAAILIEDVPDRPEWAAVRDRIARCAAPAP